MKRLLAATILGLLVVPATASAHPGVFDVTSKVRAANTSCVNPDASCLVDGAVQYAVGNDGWARSFTEANDIAPGAGRGIINYRLMPSAWRGSSTSASYRPNLLAYAPARTDLQPHATCLDAPWDTAANILAWQEDPFFNYIPWQKTSALLGDEPSHWIPVVKSLTGVDLAALNTVDEFRNACTGAGGVYHAADTSSSITDAQVAASVTPLQSQITTLQTGLTTVTAQFTAAEAARQALVARPLVLTLSGKRTPAISMITGAAGTSVKVRVLISSADAKKLKLARTLATKTKTLDAQGAALFSLTPSAKARKAIKRQVKVTVEAVAGGVTKTASGVYVG